MNIAAALTEKLSARTLLGSSIVDLDNETVGTLTDFLIDLEMNRVAYALVSLKSHINDSAALFAIPFAAFEFDPSSSRFVLSVDREKLKTAPGIQEDRWPDTADRSWGDAIHGHYDLKPYYNAF